MSSLELREDSDTICALSTPSGVGGIAVVRASGPRAYDIARRLCSFLPEQIESHRAHVGVVRESAGEPIDEAVVLSFARGRSFTGDETCEFSCHGSPTVVATLLRELIAAGCRSAKPGEFTYRAFMNGRIDLVQAEGVLSLIESQTKDAARASLRQLQGALSREFSGLEDGVVWLLARLEASIDFSAEGIEVTPSRELLGRTDDLIAQCRRLIASHDDGRILHEGVQVALVGEPNVGKSSLLNALLGEDRAIVTAEPGTTRDLVEGRLILGGTMVRLVDTAGLRETESEAERLGIQRSRRAADQADVVLAVLDAGRSDDGGAWAAALDRADPERMAAAAVINKMDLPKAREREPWLESAAQVWQRTRPDLHVFFASASSGAGLDEIRRFLEARSARRPLEAGATVLQARHFEVLKRIELSLNAARRLIAEDSSPDFIAFELQEAVRGVHELLGHRFDEQVIDRIFKEFCLGK